MHTLSKKLFTGLAVAAFLAVTFTALARDTDESNSEPELRRIDHRSSSRSSDDRVSVLGSDVLVAADETVHGDAVGVMTNVTVDGTVEGNSVAVLGNNTINGTVHGDVVAVLGDLTLGPKAHVDGQLVCVGGKLTREEGSTVRGKIVQKEVGGQLGIPLRQWWRSGLSHGAPLALGPHLGWLWVLNGFLCVFYVLLALVFPGGIRKCGNTLKHRPAVTIFSAFLVVLGLPILFILLLITIVGIPVALVLLPLALIVGVLFGRASIYALVGDALSGGRLHPALAVLLGALVCLALYLVPIVGLALSLCVAFIGLGCVVTTLFASTGAPGPAVAAATASAAASPAVPGAPPMVPPVMAAPTVAPSAPAALDSGTAASPAMPASPPLLAQAPAVVTESAVGLPRAGFWIRMVALLIDFLLVSVMTMGGLGHPHIILLVLAVYGAILWKHKGATVGGIIFGLKVLRLDDRPVDWGTAWVRAFSCFFSLVVVGFGFIWIAFDREKQAWHDKIAGTVVVRAPKGVSLI